MERYFNSPPEDIVPVLDGRDIMRILGVGEGPHVGRYLSLLVEEQREGRISTKKEALDFLKK